MKEKIMVAMSGGVDSSLAAALLVEAGYDCIGATMLLNGTAGGGPFGIDSVGSPAGDAAADAARVAKSLGIPFYTFDLTREFRDSVIEPFIAAYRRGTTPNPCVVCNRTIKFGLLSKRARELGCDALATGHYARIEQEEPGGRYLLKKAADAQKDQSYFLYALPREALSRIRFPLGGLLKSDVRRMARERGLESAERPESQDICFIPDGRYAEYIESHVASEKGEAPCLSVGNFVDREGNVLGEHEGIIRYTIGQRKGLGISRGEPMYVLAVDATDHTVTLGPDEALFADTLYAADLHFLSLDRLEGPTRLKAKIRSRQTEQWATVTQPDDDTLCVVFDEPQRAITPGQAVVLYEEDLVVGGGVIAGTTVKD